MSDVFQLVRCPICFSLSEELLDMLGRTQDRQAKAYRTFHWQAKAYWT